jgi:hypothetical protein
MRISSVSLIAALALACGVAHAQAYRWVDKDGKVRYSDVPPPGVKATPLKPPPAPPATPPSAASKDPASKDSKDGKDSKDAKKGPATPAEQEQAYKERQAKAREAREKEEKERAAAEVRKQNCASAQESLRTLEAGRRISSTNAKGETVFLDESQVQDRMNNARKAVADNCS